MTLCVCSLIHEMSFYTVYKPDTTGNLNQSKRQQSCRFFFFPYFSIVVTLRLLGWALRRIQKIDEMSARARSEPTRVIAGNLECGWVHPEEDVERTMRDDSGNYHHYCGRPYGQFFKWVARANQEDVEASRVEASVSSSPPMKVSRHQNGKSLLSCGH